MSDKQIDQHRQEWDLVSVDEDFIVTDHQGYPVSPESVLAVAYSIVNAYESGVQELVDKAQYKFIMRFGGVDQGFTNIVDNYDGNWWPDEDARLYVESMRDDRRRREESRERAEARKNLPPKKHPGYVYLMRSDTRYKIGRAKNVQSRRKSIQSAIGMPVEIVGFKKVECSVVAELEMHRRFNGKRTLGEWFDLSNTDVATIMEEWS